MKCVSFANDKAYDGSDHSTGVFTLLNDFHFDSILQDRIPFTGGVAKSKIFSNYIHRYVQQDLAMQFEAI